MTQDQGVVLSYAGRTFSGSDFDDLSDACVFHGGEFSVAFDARWDRLDSWSSVICLSKSQPKGKSTDLIRIFNRGSPTLTFEISHGPRKTYKRIDAQQCITLGQKHQFLCTVSSDGWMQIFKDADLIAEDWGWAPAEVPRDCVLVGADSALDHETFFEGLIENMFVWNTARSWEGMPLTPVLTSRGNDFSAVPGKGSGVEVICADGFDGNFGGAFSIAFRAKWNHVRDWSTIVCFSQSQEYGEPTDAIRVFGRASTNTLTFQVSHGPWRNYRRVDASNCITPGEVHAYLCSVTSEGHMKIYKDGSIVNTNSDGWPPVRTDRSQFLVGECASRPDCIFCGLITDVKAWDAEVSWDDIPEVHASTARRSAICNRNEAARKFRQAASGNDVYAMERQILAESSSLLRAADARGQAALHYAASSGAVEAVLYLLLKRADPNMTDRDGLQPLDEAEWWYVKSQKAAEKAKEYCDTLETLQKHGGTHSEWYVTKRRPRLQQWASDEGVAVPWPTWQQRNPAGVQASAARPPTSGQVVLNCANIGHTFAETVLRRKGDFDWEGVSRAIEFYEAKGVWVRTVCKVATLHRNPLPDKYWWLQKRLSMVPNVDMLGKGVDDLFTLRIAQKEDCQFVDNDNYRDWKSSPTDPQQAGAGCELRGWLIENEQRLRVSYIFTADGQFVPLQ